ncbi:MAG: Mrp/NBP35 family ATP-binding protein [Candidatus Eisenbacteria bacterium]|uniref:Iron-sulfur cluster carrier protein n=1 Tax=Eiseniibacteriota bacterium TaxID=2212470 RepID=A0A7Y2H2A4_UNCEI|nr:Mrp/NBP35 family ATP-binding protein [Candidatus Eisenbacteria bacterium]
MSAPTEQQILDALRPIRDPDLNQDIVSLGFIKNLEIANGKVSFAIELTTPACPVKDMFEREAMERVGAVEGVQEVDVTMTSNVVAAPASAGADVLPGVRHTVAIASGKGGVGKSTVAVNLAVALAQTGARVGLMDADVYGPSIPIMMGLKTARPTVGEGKLQPLDRFGIKMMSIGFIAGEETPVIWRGPMVTKLIRQFLTDVDWGELDYLLIDLPPGTGDAQLTLAQAAPLAGAIIVTTPQDVALEDVKRGVRMFERVNVPVVGIVENMSFFVCSNCGDRHEIFHHGGGEKAAANFEVPFLGAIPLHGKVREGGDAGVPILSGTQEGPIAEAFVSIGGAVARELSTLAFPQPEASV